MLRNLLKAYSRNNNCVRYKGSAVHTEVLQKLDEGFDKLMKSNSTSLLKKHLTRELFEKLKTKRTKTSTLWDCIQSGLIHHDSSCGIYAACPESYRVFAELFDPVIKDCHFGFKDSNKQPAVDFGDPSVFEDIDPRNNFIASTRIQCARSLKGYPFNPRMTVDQFNQIEDTLHCISSSFEGEHKGKYHSLLRLDRAVRMNLTADYHLFEPNDRFLEAANAFQHWPVGRGVFRNFDKTFLVWCNEQDHLSIISMQRGGHFGEVYARLIRGLSSIEKYIPFVRDDRLGFLTVCPTNLGTAIRASVQIKIPRLAANKAVLEDVAVRYKLQVHSSDREDTKAKAGYFVISNRRRLGLTEFDAVSDLYCAIREIIQLEKSQQELKPAKRKPQLPPPHIDPQKAIKSGLIDERKSKRKSASAQSALKSSLKPDP